MTGKVAFELVSPSRILVSEPVDMVVIPGTEGNFGVLPGHAPLISTIRPGTIEIYEGSTVRSRIFIAGGVAEVALDRCTVLADDAMPTDQIDRAEADAELRAAKARLTEADADTAAAERAVRTAEAKLEALGAGGSH